MKPIPGIQEELAFWKDFVYTEQFESWLQRGTPAPELDPRIVDLVRKERGRVLDVGSGAVSILWSICPDLLATDLLGKEYLYLFDYSTRGIQLPVPIAGEELPYHEEFQVVHMRNALDHSQDPVRVWCNLKRAVRPGGLLIVAGFENEGTYLRNLGMHQWDLSLYGGTVLTVTTPSKEKFVLDIYPFHVQFADIKDLPNGRRWVTWVGRKCSTPAPN